MFYFSILWPSKRPRKFFYKLQLPSKIFQSTCKAHSFGKRFDLIQKFTLPKHSTVILLFVTTLAELGHKQRDTLVDKKGEDGRLRTHGGAPFLQLVVRIIFKQLAVLQPNDGWRPNAHRQTRPLGCEEIQFDPTDSPCFRIQHTQTFPPIPNTHSWTCLHKHARTHTEHCVGVFLLGFFDKQQQWPLRKARRRACDHREWKRSQSEMSTVPVVLALTQNCQERGRVCLLGTRECDTHSGVLIPRVCSFLSCSAPKTLVPLFAAALCGAAAQTKSALSKVLPSVGGGGAKKEKRPEVERGRRRNCRYEEAEVYWNEARVW